LQFGKIHWTLRYCYSTLIATKETSLASRNLAEPVEIAGKNFRELWTKIDQMIKLVTDKPDAEIRWKNLGGDEVGPMLDSLADDLRRVNVDKLIDIGTTIHKAGADAIKNAPK
jgi:hypothetical protein